MEKVLDSLQAKLTHVRFVEDASFYWSPKTKSVHYVPGDEVHHVWSLLHETAHAKLKHTEYESDFDLITLEADAWQEAKHLASEFAIQIDEDHIQDCLDTYRDWLHQRSTCPSCSAVSLQRSPNEYRCHNCYTVWRVSNSRFCRPYRLRTAEQNKKLSEQNTQTTFV